MSNDISICSASPEDAKQLAHLRADAMRPSLEAVGRFDPERAKRRLLDTFSPADTNLIKKDGTVIGFYVVKRFADHLYLDQLHIQAYQQGQGIGRKILETVKEEARGLALPIRLSALKDSRSNAFYEASGFRFVAAEAFDNHYDWQPQ